MSTFFDQTDEDYDDSKYESIIDFSSDFDRNISDDSTDTNVRPTSKTMIEVLENVKADDEFLNETDGRRLHCAHVYHAGCIIQWLENSNMCSLCRHKLPVVDFDLNLYISSC
ncbi:hypothetical protein ERO13_A03G016566v2 [Gossypium hirsutum]|uniref:RING-type E3 ubiquitin transferase n=1 Tax=Gossypium darwinii TaxID=34276 RepID=A0A5D2H0B8_GOSDA|nr:hypothetical protein ERO13_A03G016566v2 [Gossypium hirsutum]TYH23632.1 hypothetical protein ES288_A03G029200v1 [Gossypium darwinii]